MGPLSVALDSPVFNQGFGPPQRQEPMLVQTFVAELPIEAINIGIFHRFTGPDERQLYAG